jgi:hypothetical protein
MVGLTVITLGLALSLGLGCGRKSSSRAVATPPPIYFEDDPVVQLFPGGTTQLKVFGEPAKVEPSDNAVTAKLEGDQVIFSASPDARKGNYTVRVLNSKGEGATVKVAVLVRGKGNKR